MRRKVDLSVASEAWAVGGFEC